MKKLIALLFLVSVIFTCFSSSVRAGESEFITVVNPVRIAHYTKDVAATLRSQYSVVSQNGIGATWLLTYDVLNEDKAIPVLKSFNRSQEFGIWLEITRSSAKAVGIEFHETGSWHHADAVFLAGYTRDERIKFIDAVFEKFKSRFGYYPTSIGSWWTDSYSLAYMKEKYEVTANLGVADQFSTDNYQVWGQYWGLPFYPSKYNPAIPASNTENKVDIVNLQWAPRDPLNGYTSSLYSTQDYPLVEQNISYFEKLIFLYGKKQKNDFGHITLGLEGDTDPENYKGEYAKQMNLVRRLVNRGEFNLLNMRDFSSWYRNKYPQVSPPSIVETENLVVVNEEDRGAKVVWYQSPKYRIGLVYRPVKQEVKVLDLRVYNSNFLEPYFFSPIGEKTLYAYNPAIFDEAGHLKSSWVLPVSKEFATSGNSKNFAVALDKLQIALTPEKFTLTGTEIAPPDTLVRNQTLTSSVSGATFTFEPTESWLAPLGGVLVKALTPEAAHFLASTKLRIVFLLLVALGIFLAVIIAKSKRIKFYLKVPLIIVLFTLPFPIGQAWRNSHLTNYLVAPAEIDALNQLSLLPEGKVVVMDAECLQCEYHTEYKPPAFANQREYVENLTGKKIVKNSSIFKADTREKAYKAAKSTKAKYVYLVKFEKYIEKMPFSPGDLKAELLYENANAQIWRLN